jgi:hypothetical protein
MIELTGYLDEFVEPTLDEFRRDPFSRRRAYLACVAIYHAIDRYPLCGQAREKAERDALREAWRAESEEFEIVEIAAHDSSTFGPSCEKKPRGVYSPRGVSQLPECSEAWASTRRCSTTRAESSG